MFKGLYLMCCGIGDGHRWDCTAPSEPLSSEMSKKKNENVSSRQDQVFCHSGIKLNRTCTDGGGGRYSVAAAGSAEGHLDMFSKSDYISNICHHDNWPSFPPRWIKMEHDALGSGWLPNVGQDLAEVSFIEGNDGGRPSGGARAKMFYSGQAKCF